VLVRESVVSRYEQVVRVLVHMLVRESVGSVSSREKRFNVRAIAIGA
jgi:hypothetical protein